MKCECTRTERLHGAAGQEYEHGHLRELAVDLESWQMLLECPETGLLWKKYYPNPQAHGGGAPDYVKIPREIAEEEFDIPAQPSSR
jgi:hypothetical protein